MSRADAGQQDSATWDTEEAGRNTGVPPEKASSWKAGDHTDKLLASLRITFGAIFLFDGILKWAIFATGSMQGTLVSMWMLSPAPPSIILSNWLLFGVLVAIGETLGGVFLIVGIFQKPAALWSAAIMLSIWIYGGMGGWVGMNASGFGYNTDPGGDLMMVPVFLFLAFIPNVYSLSAYLRLPERFPFATRGTFRRNALAILFR